MSASAANCARRSVSQFFAVNRVMKSSRWKSSPQISAKYALSSAPPYNILYSDQLVYPLNGGHSGTE